MRRFFNRSAITLLGIVVIFSFFQFSPSTNLIQQEVVIRREKADPPFLSVPEEWVDSVYNSLTRVERIAQLLMIPAYPNENNDHIIQTSELISKYDIGGIIFFQGSPDKQARMTRHFQSKAKTPLLIAMDAEWGLAMRMDSTISYPRQMMLGAIQDEMQIYHMGADLAKQFKLLGVHVNFAPVIDVNNNPDNPVINSRSFGEDRANVARKGLLYMRGMQDNGVLAVAKHFPGHGDTDTDSHFDLPVINHSKNRLDSVELFPFKELIYCGISGIMVAHLNVPSLDNSKEKVSTLSVDIVDSLLQQELKFKGLVFTDAMGMQGVIKDRKPEDANVKALLAGNDILLMPENIPKTINLIDRAIRRGKYSEAELEKHCKKVLAAKYWAGLNNYEPPVTDSLQYKLNLPEYRFQNRKLIESALTLLENKNDLVPFKALDTLNIAAVSIGYGKTNEFQETISLYMESENFNIHKNAGRKEFNQLLSDLNSFNLVIIGIHNTDMRPSREFGITDETIRFVDSLVQIKPTIVSLFGNPYALDKFKNLSQSSALLEAYEDNADTRDLSAQVLFGGIGADGRLPVSVFSGYVSGDGITTKGSLRLKYTMPWEVHMDENMLLKIDSIAQAAISDKATPGCQVIVARNGKVIYNKAFGYKTYRKKSAVKTSDLYDIASVTKISATVPSLMHLYEEGKIHLTDKIADYLPYLDTTAKKNIIIRDILLHQAGLKSWIPFYLNTLEPIYPSQELSSNNYSYKYPFQIGPHYFMNKHIKYKDNYYSRQKSDVFSVQVADGLYMNKTLIDTIFHYIANSELSDSGKYIYSDLGFYMFYKLIEDVTDTALQDYVQSMFYKKLGASTLGYLPLSRFGKDRIAPTENDIVFRRQIVHGYVHDPGAAMLGGVSGHAGLFTNANDLAKLMHVYLNNGTYGGIKYFEPETIELFTSCMECNNGNRRGLGFDKPQIDTTKPGPTITDISLDSYGHSGFTGTLAWVDPSEQIVYIFLSNRVFPDAIHNKLVTDNVRTKIQQVIYDAIIR